MTFNSSIGSTKTEEKPPIINEKVEGLDTVNRDVEGL